MKKFALLTALLLCLSIGASAQYQKLTLNLKPGGHWQTSRNFTRVGNFVGAFDSNTDVEVYVLDTYNFAAWSRGESFSSVYSSGRTSKGNFDVRLGKGIWYFVVSNKFSYISSKTVGIAYSAHY
jgi:hypothetical protein